MTNTDEAVKYLSQYSLEDVLSGIIEMQMQLYGDGVDSLIPASEYFAANALFACKKSGNKPFQWEDYLELENHCEQLFTPIVEELFDEIPDFLDAADEENGRLIKHSQHAAGHGASG